MSIRTILGFNLRYYQRHLWLSVLCLLGISLGVGIVVAVQLINDSALRSFSASVDFLAGRATHSVVGEYGPIDEALFAEIWKNPRIKVAAPVVEVIAETQEIPGEPLRFIGLDPFLDTGLRDLAPARQGDDDGFQDFLTGRPPGAFVSSDLKDDYGISVGSTLTVLTAGIRKPVKIVGFIKDGGAAGPGDTAVVTDISAAQELFGRQGYLDKIDIVTDADEQTLEQELPPGLRLVDKSERKRTLESMLYSFRLNLAAMSLLALFTGIFLIYNFSMFSVLSRREDMSLLLTLGSDRRELFGAFILESLLLGAVGSIAGIGLGYVVAWAGMDRISSTINELYFHVNVDQLTLTWPIALSGIGVGFLATLIGTGLPSLEVASAQPIVGMKRRSIEDRAHGLKRGLALGGGVLLVVSVVTGLASKYSVYWGFVSAFALTMAFALFTPSILSPLTHILSIWLRDYGGSLTGFLGARTVKASLSRTSVAVAALAVALSMTLGVDNMIFSFRESVRTWLEGALRGDLYISPSTSKWAHPLPKELIERLMDDPRIDAVERYAMYDVFVDRKPVKLRVLDARVLRDRTVFRFLESEPQPWDRLIGGGVFVSESLAYRFGVGPGDRIELQTPDGARSFTIVAVNRDYSHERGTVQIDREVYEKIRKDTRVQSAAVFLKKGHTREEVRKDIIKGFPGLDRTVISNTAMTENILKIFDKTFTPTATLKGASLFVALLGIATALTAVLTERSTDMIVMGYLGLTRNELAAMNFFQAGIMGVTSFLIACVCGMLLTYILVHAINYRSFGWSIDLYFDYRVYLKVFGLTLAACLSAAVLPSLKIMKRSESTALHEE
jgi:putative ABC transport system permease protein